MVPITLLDVAKARGVQEDEKGMISMAEFRRVGVPMIGGCQICGATVAAYNSCPSKSGYIRCADGCIGDEGFETIGSYEEWCTEWDGEEEEC